MKLGVQYFFGNNMKKIILILLSVFLYSSSFANNHNDNTIDLIQGTISEGLEEISSSGQSAGNILGGTYTFLILMSKLAGIQM